MVVAVLSLEHLVLISVLSLLSLLVMEAASHRVPVGRQNLSDLEAGVLVVQQHLLTPPVDQI